MSKAMFPIKLYLWTVKLKFHTVLMYRKKLFLIFFQPFKNVKRILILQAAPKQTVGEIWPGAHCLLFPVLDHRLARREVDQ